MNETSFVVAHLLGKDMDGVVGEVTDPRHAVLVTAARAMRTAGVYVDMVTVGSWLKHTGLDRYSGGMDYMMSLLDKAPADPEVDALPMLPGTPGEREFTFVSATELAGPLPPKSEDPQSLEYMQEKVGEYKELLDRSQKEVRALLWTLHTISTSTDEDMARGDRALARATAALEAKRKKEKMT